MNVTRSKEGSVTVLKAVGPIVADEIEDFVQALENAAQDGELKIAVDLHEVPFIDSAGLELLAEVQEKLQRAGGALKLVGPTSLCRRILEVTRLAEVFEIHQDSLGAVRSFL